MKLKIEHHVFVHFENPLVVHGQLPPNSLSAINDKLDQLIMKQSEFNAKVLEFAPKVVRVLDEIRSEIDKLKTSDPDVSPEGAESIAKIDTALSGLDDLAPELPTAPPVG